MLDGRAFFIDSLWSAAARRRIADLGPPGGEPARATEEVVLPAEGVEESGPDSGPEFRGEAGRGEDWWRGNGLVLEVFMGRAGEARRGRWERLLVCCRAGDWKYKYHCVGGFRFRGRCGAMRKLVSLRPNGR